LHNIVGSFGLTVSRPGFHELTALLQRVAPSVGLFGLITYDMRQCGLCDFTGEVGDVPRPIPEAGAEAVNGGVLDSPRSEVPSCEMQSRPVGKRRKDVAQVLS